MPFEYRSDIGLIRLIRVRGRWQVSLNGRQAGSWDTPDLAAAAVASHRSGLAAWDDAKSAAPRDLDDWTPTGTEL